MSEGDGPRVYFDETRGHIRIDDLVFADTGNALHVWAHSGCVLTTDTARDLADALNAWVARYERRAERKTA